jgi:hypothetical protein
MSKRQSANGTQSPMRGTPPVTNCKDFLNIYINNSYEKHTPITWAPTNS